MDFKEIVNASRPVAVSAAEQQQRVNNRISDVVIAAAKEDILKEARNCPQNGKCIDYTGMVYLGTPDDGLFSSIVVSDTTEVKSFLSIRNTLYTTYKISSNGQELLRSMQSIARADGIDIHGYSIGFGHPDVSEHGDYYTYEHGIRLIVLMNPHIHSLPVEVKYTGRSSSAFFRCLDTNGEFKKYTLPNARQFPQDSMVGVYVCYSYKG